MSQENLQVDMRLARALQVAIRVHAGQVDEQDEPYLLHVERVVAAVGSYEAKIVAALHDVIEDGELTLAHVAQLCDLGPLESGAIGLLTRHNLVYDEYIEEMTKEARGCGPLARQVKRAELRDDLVRMPPTPDWDDLRVRRRKALRRLEAIA